MYGESDKKDYSIHTLSLPKEHASKMKVGDPVEMYVKGTVKEVREPYEDIGHYTVDLENPESRLVETDKADKNAAEMPLPALKKKISEKSEEMESGWDEPTYK